MKQSERSKKLATVVQPQLMPLINRFSSPAEVGLVTITAIEISGDLGVCDIFVRSVGGPSNFHKKLDKYAKKIAHEISQRVPTRRTMVLRFKRDKSTDLIDNLEKNNL